ncbi:CLUMA_CG010697, isoform A [Clunio marinus]|uniref:CLUMA_CG010697, isoform A n=1 Tax=Clunio marinus TaxID=568069 RepID=A0A1J1IE75_9DIPT|nr:CLUMA_CG010697, isoform A [Clunio marinus]
MQFVKFLFVFIALIVAVCAQFPSLPGGGSGKNSSGLGGLTGDLPALGGSGLPVDLPIGGGDSEGGEDAGESEE